MDIINRVVNLHSESTNLREVAWICDVVFEIHSYFKLQNAAHVFLGSLALNYIPLVVLIPPNKRILRNRALVIIINIVEQIKT